MYLLGSIPVYLLGPIPVYLLGSIPSFKSVVDAIGNYEKSELFLRETNDLRGPGDFLS